MEPIDKLKLMTVWDAEPAITEDDLTELLTAAALQDTAGRPPLDDEWSPTYDLNSAAAQAWLIKAAKAAATVEVDPPESGIVTSKVFDNCRKMARIFAGKRSITVTTR